MNCALHTTLNSARMLGHWGWVFCCQGVEFAAAKGLSLLLSGVDFAAVGGWLYCFRGLTLLLPGVDFAAAGVWVCYFQCRYNYLSLIVFCIYLFHLNGFCDKKHKEPYIKHKDFRFLSVLQPSVLHPSVLHPFITLRVPPLKSETGWTGELWSKTYLLNWQNEENSIFFSKKIFFNF